MKRLILACTLALSAYLPVDAIPVTSQPGGIDAAHTFGFNGTLTNAAHTVAFGTTGSGGTITLSTISVLNLSTTDSIFIQTNGAAASGSSAEIKLGPGNYYTYQGTALPSVSIFTAGTSVPYSVGAN